MKKRSFDTFTTPLECQLLFEWNSLLNKPRKRWQENSILFHFCNFSFEAFFAQFNWNVYCFSWHKNLLKSEFFDKIFIIAVVAIHFPYIETSFNLNRIITGFIWLQQVYRVWEIMIVLLKIEKPYSVVPWRSNKWLIRSKDPKLYNRNK